MSHLDEGLLTALLDNELAEDERRSAEAHLTECAECRHLFEEIKAFAAEADGLVAAVEVPARSAAQATPMPAPTAKAHSRWMMRRWPTMAWAASVLLALGLGWAASDLQRRMPSGGHDDAIGQRPAVGQQKEEAPAAEPGDAPSARAPAPLPPAPAPAAITSTAQAAQRERNVVVPDGPAERDEKAAPVNAAGQLGRRDGEAVPGPPLNQPADAAKSSRAAAPSADYREMAAFGDASASAGAVSPAAPEARAQEGLVARRAAPGLRQVRMEEAVRTLGGSIRLMDGLEVRRILAGPGSLAGATDSSTELVRVVYEDPPGRELWLDQQRPAMLELKPGKASGPLPGDTITTRDGTGPLRVRWVDEHGFRLTLTGFLAADSLNAMIRRVH